MKIGFVSRNAFPLDCVGQRGGVGRYFSTIVPELAARGVEVHVISENLTNAYLQEAIAGGTVHYLPRWRETSRWSRVAEAGMMSCALGRSFWADISMKVRRTSILSDWLHAAITKGPLRGIDLIEFPEIGAEGFRFMRSHPPVPTVARVHGPTQFLMEVHGFEPSAGRSLLCWAERDAVLRSSGVTAPSRYAAELASSVWGLSKELPVAIPNPLNVDAFCPSEESQVSSGKLVLLYSGRLQSSKGLSGIPAIVRALHHEGIDFEIRFAGKDTDLSPNGYSYVEYLKAEVGHEFEDYLVFLGHLELDELIAELQNADLCIYLSVETFGYACCEAMACGSAVLVHGVGAFAEFVSHKQNGFVVNADNKEQLVEVVLEACKDKLGLASMGRAARETIVSRFSVSGVCDDLLEFYSTVLSRG